MALILSGIPQTLQSAATTGNGSTASFTPKARNIHVTVSGSGTISGGTIAIQEANSESYAGSWSTVQSFPATDLTGGAQKIFHYAGMFKALRVAITSNITGGGTISAEVQVD